MIALVQDIMRRGLSMVGKTFDGAAYSHIELSCEGKNLKNLYSVLN